MAFEDNLLTVIRKLADNQKPTATELDELFREARRLKQAELLLNSIVKPPGKFLVIDGFRIAGGDVLGDDKGLFIKNSAEAWFNFGDANNTRGVVNIACDPNDDLEIVNLTDDGTISFFLNTNGDENNRVLFLQEDPAKPGRAYLGLENQDAHGTRLVLNGGASAEALIDLRTEGTASGSTFLRMRETSNTPEDPSEGDAFHVYIKSDKFVIQYNDAGTVRYKYLDLTGVTATWTATTVAP